MRAGARAGMDLLRDIAERGPNAISTWASVSADGYGRTFADTRVVTVP